MSWGMGLRTSAASLLLSLVFCAGVARAQPDRAARTPRGTSGVEPTETGFDYTVASGDTLSDLAVRFEVSVDDLLRWNEGLRPDRIRSGQRVHVEDGLRRVQHTISRGESLSRIAARYEVRVSELLGWNARLSPDRIAVGRELVVFTRQPTSRSLSIGSPSAGRLDHGRRLPPNPGFRVRRPGRAYGTDESVRWLVEAVDALHRSDPRAPRLEVHDLSFRAGGPIHGHHSHESGRDADLSYFQQRCPRGVCRFRRIGPEQLDVARQWALFRHWIDRGQVEVIFVDHALQRALYEHARSEGASRRDLNRWFQYPRAIENRGGLIRHHPHHADHFHVRFVCPESDSECR